MHFVFVNFFKERFKHKEYQNNHLESLGWNTLLPGPKWKYNEPIFYRKGIICQEKEFSKDLDKLSSKGEKISFSLKPTKIKGEGLDQRLRLAIYPRTDNSVR